MHNEFGNNKLSIKQCKLLVEDLTENITEKNLQSFFSEFKNDIKSIQINKSSNEDEYQEISSADKLNY